MCLILSAKNQILRGESAFACYFVNQPRAFIAKFMDRGAERNLIWRPSNFDVARESNDECIHGTFAGFCCDDDAASSLFGGARQFMTRLTAFMVPRNE